MPRMTQTETNHSNEKQLTLSNSDFPLRIEQEELLLSKNGFSQDEVTRLREYNIRTVEDFLVLIAIPNGFEALRSLLQTDEKTIVAHRERLVASYEKLA